MFRVGFFANVDRGQATDFSVERDRLVAGFAFRDPALRAELNSLAREADRELFFEGLLGIGQRLERDNELESAASVYAAIVGAIPPLTEDKRERPLQGRAQARLDAIQGRGPLGNRVEFLLRNFAREATRPDMILGMTAAGLVASTVRLGVLSRLLASPMASWFNRGAGAAMTASAAAFLPETAAFWATSRSCHLLLGEAVDWTPSGIGREWASLALTLGFLKAGGALSRGLFHRVHGVDPLRGELARLPSFSRISRPLFEQAGTFLGIHLGHLAETRLGLRPAVSGDTAWLDSLATLLHFHVGSRLAHQMMGPAHAQRMQGLFLQAERLEAFGNASLRPAPSGEFRFPTIFAMAMGDATGLIPRGPREIWGEWLGGRERPQPKFYRTPVYEYGDQAEYLDGLRSATRELDPEVRCLFVEVDSQNGYGDWGQVRELLRAHPQLQEMRFRFLDGRLVWIAKDEQGRLTSETEEADPEDPVHRGLDLAIGEVHRVRLRPRWAMRRASADLHETLRVAREGSGLSQGAVAVRLLDDPALMRALESYRGGFRGEADLRAMERETERPVPFPLLRALAELYRQDVRPWIVASNRALFPNLDRSHWDGDRYPLYIESKTDADRLSEFEAATEGRGRGSFGWQLFVARKNPDQYFSVGALAQRVGILPKMLHDFERNAHSPNAATLRALVEALNLTEGDLVGPLARTFHPDLPLAELFPGQEVFLTPHSLDREKVTAYAQDPGSLGQYLFAARKLLPGFPAADDVSAQLGRNPIYYQQHESNAVHVGRDNLHEWYWLWNRLGLPRELFLEIMERRHGIPRQDPAYLLAEALDGKSLEEVQAETEISTKTLSAILQQRGNQVTPESIASLKEALPRLDAARLYLHYYPELPFFFPESADAAGSHLRIDRVGLSAFFKNFHFGELLYAHRMGANPPLSTVEMAERLGWDNPTVGRHERQFSRIEEDGTLRRIAEVLGLPAHELYLYFRPEILRIFPLRDSANGGAFSLSDGEYRALLAPQNGAYDRNNLRRRLSPEILRLPAQNDVRGNLDAARTLANAFQIEVGQAQKLLDPARPLSDEDLRWLAERFPRISFREWYEHFHRSELAYFLGRREDGSFDYRIPEGMDFSALSRLELVGRIETLFQEGRVNIPRSVRRSLNKNGNPGDATLVQLSNWTGLSRRLLYLYFRRAELRPILENSP